jgi:taurine transport system permease protein
MPDEAAWTAKQLMQETSTSPAGELKETARRVRGSKGKRLLKSAISTWGISIVSVSTAVVIWYLITAAGMINPLFLPAPTAVWSSFLDMLREGYKDTSLAVHVGTSLTRLMLALLLAVITAVPLGMISGHSKLVYRIIDPFIQFYRPLPPLAYYTLLIIWFGIQETSKISLLYLAAFAPLYLAAVTAVQRVPKDRILAARTFGTNDIQLFRHVILPSSLPELYTGLRTAVGFTFTTLVAAEMVAAQSGMGWMVLDASKFLRSDIIFVGILLMGCLAMLMDWCILKIQKKHIPWVGKD